MCKIKISQLQKVITVQSPFVGFIGGLLLTGKSFFQRGTRFQLMFHEKN